jgi:hypothetical protein
MALESGTNSESLEDWLNDWVTCSACKPKVVILKVSISEPGFFAT